MTKKRKKELKEIAFAIFQAEQSLQNNLTTEEDTLNNIEKIVNQLKQLATEVTIVNYKESVA